MKLVTVSQMLKIEAAADAGGLTYAHMMENAGAGLAAVIQEKYTSLPDRTILGLVGKGNNGGDALVALAHLAQHGWHTSAYLVGERTAEDTYLARLRQAGGQVVLAGEDANHTRLNSLVQTHRLLLDGLLGTGIRLPLRPPYPELLSSIRRQLKSLSPVPFVVAVDCPSGIDCDTGQAPPECLPADLTVCMAAVKTGMLRFPAFELLGELRLVDIGLPEDLKPWQAVQRRVVDSDMVSASLPPRPIQAHKGTFGTALIVAGSLNYTGAAWLAGQAAFRSGAGLVTMAVPEPLHAVLAGHFPEATWLLLPHDSGAIAAPAHTVVHQHLAHVTAWLLGPGLGLSEPTAEFLARLLDFQDPLATPPLVIDADGLKLLAALPDWPRKLPAPAVLTPHPGEMALLTGLPANEIQANRLEIAEQYAAAWGHVLILKGANTIIASPDGNTAVIPVATPALARAGTGDVLAGLVVGLRAQGVAAYPAAYAATWLHAQAGLAAARRLGPASVLAGDLLDEIPGVLTTAI